MQVSIAVDWMKQLDRNMRLLIGNVQNTQDMNKEVIALVDQNIDEIFKQKWKNVEKWKKWGELAPSTIKARERRRWYYKQAPNSPSTLRRTWRLQEKRNKTVTKYFWQLQMLQPYAVYHHRWWKPNPPQRSIIDLNNKLNSDIIRAIQTVIYKGTGIRQI